MRKITIKEVAMLKRYNFRVSEGILHTIEYNKKMIELQLKFDKETEENDEIYNSDINVIPLGGISL